MWQGVCVPPLRGVERVEAAVGAGAGTTPPPQPPTHQQLLPPSHNHLRPRLPARSAREPTAAAEAGMRLDAVDLASTCRQRALTLQSVPRRIRGALRAALRAGLRLAVHPAGAEDEVRGWKLFCLAPRKLLYRARGETRVPPEEPTLRILQCRQVGRSPAPHCRCIRTCRAVPTR